MLPKQNRLAGKETFKETKDKGKLFQSNNFGLLVVPGEENTQSRFGFIVSTKISKKAVERNRIKRLLRVAVFQLLPKIELGYNVIFLAKKGLLTANLSHLRIEVEKALQTAKIEKQ